MRKRTFVLLLFVIFFISYGLFINQYVVTIIPKELKAKNSDLFYDYKGITHVLTEKSTGSGDLNEIIEAARIEDLDFIYISDFKTLAQPSIELENNFINYNEFTTPYVFLAPKYSYLNSRIINYQSKDSTLLSSPGTTQIYISDLLERTDRDIKMGYFILAHPFKRGFEWSGSYPANLNGLEVLNLKQIWEDSWLYSKPSFFWTLFLYPFNPRLALIRLFEYPEREARLWDEISQKHPFVGYSGTNAESKLILPFGMEAQFPSYENLFHISKTHILLDSELTGQPVNDRKKIEEAMSRGQFYFSLDLLANPKGFEAHIADSKESIFPIGSRIQFRSDLIMNIRLPHKPNVPFDVIVFKNGEKLMISNSQETTYKIHRPGVYRVEVRVIPTFPLPDGKKWVTWIYTNPFYVE